MQAGRESGNKYKEQQFGNNVHVLQLWNLIEIANIQVCPNS